ncbi:MAG: AraC family transcriptional regulator, partial [Balneolales bacterium]
PSGHRFSAGGEGGGPAKSVKVSPSSGTLRIKNMVCDRCIMIVEQLLRERGFRVERVTLGEAVVSPPPDADQLSGLEQALTAKGFELTFNRRDELVTTIKSELIAYLRLTRDQDNPPLLSEYLARKLHKSYPTISRTFSASEGLSIEKYLIRMKIEHVKELLSYGEMTLSEIAWKLGYSSVQHLSGQFRATVGTSVSKYLKSSEKARRTLDHVR